MPAKKKGKVGAARDPKRRAEMVAKIGETSFKAGNKYWMRRHKSGVSPLYEGPEGAAQLLDEADRYLEWIEENPIMESKVVTFQGMWSLAKVPKMRVATTGGFCLHLGITPQTWINWRARTDLLEVVATIENAIYEYKFAGAAADMLNPSIIARDLGLADKTELTGPGGSPIETVNTNMTAKEAADLYQQTRDQNKK